jgi:hypothetical protein
MFLTKVFIMRLTTQNASVLMQSAVSARISRWADV